jgi:GR25 family glycosyltransferase involved in LPS biosynthesis
MENTKGIDLATLKTFVISLSEIPRNPELLNQLANQGIMAQVIRATDARSWTFPFDQAPIDVRRFVRIIGRMPVGPEVGCALSHLEVARSAKLADVDYALVLEEDASIADDLTPAIQEMQRLDPSTPNIVQLHSFQEAVLKRRTVQNVNGNDHILGEFYLPPYSTAAYLLNRSAIEILAAKPIVEGLADWPPYAYQFRFFGYFPSPVSASSENSTIESGRRAVSPHYGNGSELWNGLRNYLKLFRLGRVHEHSLSLGSKGAYLKFVLVPHTLSFFRFFRSEYMTIGTNTVKIR